MPECKWFSVCPLKSFYEEGSLDERWIRDYCRGDFKKCVRYQMEESGKPHPDNMMPDGSINKELGG